jgi:hypothetical protein
MRVFLIALITMVSLAQAQAEEPTGSKPKTNNNCSYTGSVQTYDVPQGGNICVRSPPPYTEQYTLLRCEPPLAEIDLVKRGDPRCDRYGE